MLTSAKSKLHSIIPFKSELRDLISTFSGKPAKGNGEFSKRIKFRKKTFWEAADAEKVRNTLMSAKAPLTEWKDVENWQRKLSNKYNAREFAKLHGCRVAELYWKGRDLRTLDFSKLPEHYVIRPTIGHSCHLVFLMNKRLNCMDGHVYSEDDLLKIMGKALDENPYLEFLIEEYLRTESGEYNIPNDIKFYMFNGEVARIEIIRRLGVSKGFTSYYDEKWNPMKNIGVLYAEDTYQQPPECLNELISQAKALSKSYEIFTRIDFYATDKGAVFGEFTPTPGGGNYFRPEADKMFTEYWDKFCKARI